MFFKDLMKQLLEAGNHSHTLWELLDAGTTTFDHTLDNALDLIDKDNHYNAAYFWLAQHYDNLAAVIRIAKLLCQQLDFILIDLEVRAESINEKEGAEREWR